MRSNKTLEELRKDRIEKAKELEDPIQISDIAFTIQSGSDPDKSYMVEKGSDGKWVCDCPDFQFRKYEELECKHIIRVKEYLERKARVKIEARRLEPVVDASFYG